MKRFPRMILLAGLCLIAGCEKPVPDRGVEKTSAPQPAPRRNPYLDHAQPKLDTLDLWLGAEVLVTELATNLTQISTGMMFRTNMAENEGMLFVFPFPRETGFYMRNTIVPLSAAYIGPDGRILEIVDLHPKDETPKVSETDQVQFVLEVPQGWFERKGIGPGAAIRTERGTLLETFFGRR